MKAARLKCYKEANAFQECSMENPRKEHIACAEVFKPMQTCFVEETEVELDKRRRDIERNNEWWWTNIYDENGQIGEQGTEPEITYVERVVDFTEWVRKGMANMFTYGKN